MLNVKNIASHPKFKPQGPGTRIWIGQRFLGIGKEAPACLIDACGDVHTALLLKHVILLCSEASPAMARWEDADAALCISRSSFYRKLKDLERLGFLDTGTSIRGGGTWVVPVMSKVSKKAKASKYYHEIL